MIDGGHGGQVGLVSGLGAQQMGCGWERGDSVVSLVIPWLCLAGSVVGLTARELGS